MKKKTILSTGILILLIFLVWTVLKPNKWSGFFYPDRGDLSHWVQSPGTFKSLDECRNWARNKGAELNIDRTEYDYECGLNCKPEDGLNVCEKTLD